MIRPCLEESNKLTGTAFVLDWWKSSAWQTLNLRDRILRVHLVCDYLLSCAAFMNCITNKVLDRCTISRPSLTQTTINLTHFTSGFFVTPRVRQSHRTRYLLSIEGQKSQLCVCRTLLPMNLSPFKHSWLCTRPVHDTSLVITLHPDNFAHANSVFASVKYYTYVVGCGAAGIKNLGIF